MKVPEPRKLSSGNYFIQLRLNGTSVPVTASTAAECKRQATLIKAEHKAGKRLVSTFDTCSFSSAIDNYIANRSNIVSPGTVRGYRSIQRNRFQSIMQKPIHSAINWQRVINEEAKLCSPKTLKNAWGLIRSVLDENNCPIPKVRLPQVVVVEKEWLTPEQIKVFVNALEDQDWAVAPLLALHSLRRSEIYALGQTKGIDLKKGIIHVRGACVYDENENFVYKETNKNFTSTRDVPIMIPLLSKKLKAGAKIITCAPNTLRRKINALCAENDLPKVGIHGLRHSFASLAYHLGWSELDTMRVGGWSDTQTMRKIYTHLSEIDKKKKTNSMTDFYKNANKNAN